MTPLAVIGAIQATAVAVSDVCKVLLSPEGQNAMKQWNEDAREFRRVLGLVGAWFDSTFRIALTVSADEAGNVKASVQAAGGAK